MIIGGLNSKKTFLLYLTDNDGSKEYKIGYDRIWIDGPDLLNIRFHSACARIRRDLHSNEFSVIVAGGKNEVSIL